MISIIIAMYNTDKYVYDCLKSVQDNEYDDFECIIVDDCSTDNSYEITNEFCKKDNRFKLFRNDTNRGQGYTSNYGLKQSSGDYIFFMDSDDYISKNIFTRCLPILEEKKTDAIYFNVDVFLSENDEKLKSYHSKINKQYSKHTQHRKRYIPGYSYLNNMIENSELTLSYYNYIYKREAVKHLFKENIILPDCIFTINNLVDMKQISYIDDILYHRRINSTGLAYSAMSENNASFKLIYSVYVTFYEIYKHLLKTGLYIKYNELYQNFLSIYLLKYIKKLYAKLPENEYKKLIAIKEYDNIKFIAENNTQFILKHIEKQIDKSK